MERHGDEIHVTSEEARGGATPFVMRYVLVLSTALAAALMTIVWVAGAWSTNRVADDTPNGVPTVTATK
ncbi:MAG: hypothetical protein KGL48_14355 [Sphingomonadales bacterium]|nr:hypothetical protein [Sphingomonadales bacterium]MDE2569236.1 hypothetical protein [Sphingomonadales bacterium]